MPFSSDNGKKFTREVVSRVNHSRMLDIGCGAGAYPKMFPEANWTGIEAWEPYINQYKLNELYGQIIVGDVRSMTFAHLGRFDVAIAGDVLEHMTVAEAKSVLERLKAAADTVIVSIPIIDYPQGAYNGNPFEEHIVDDWTDAKVREAFGEPDWSNIEGEIGVYVWFKQRPRLNICVYAISKNESQFVARWAKSAEDADLLLVADTGSTDNTVEECKRNGVTVHEICITPWRFDHARNASIALIPRNIDVCVSLDLDEVMEPGWREEIERVWMPGTTRLRYYFDWGHGIKFLYEKIHARHGYYWHHPCHEYPRVDGRIQEVWAQTDKLLVSHYPDPTKSRGQYIDLLELSVKEDPLCPRNAFYYARELTFHCRWQEAIVALKKYLEMPNANWINERCYAMRVMGQSYESLQQPWEAEAWYQRAAAEAPNTREPWCALATLYYKQQRWPESYAAAMRALSIKDRDFVYTVDPAVWGPQPHDLAAIAAWNMGLKEVAAEQGRIACELDPNDNRLKENLLWFSGEKTVNGNGLADNN